MLTAEEKQPKGLSLLFFTELWERFGYYAVQTIIVLYMSKGLHFSDHKSYLLFGTFASMLYITPVIGGYIADRFMGFQKAVIFGGILLTLGYSITALHSEPMFFLGLSVLIVGNGFLKPNIGSILGTLYRDEDPRREGGFTIFYMGINIGSLIPPIFIGAMVAKYGWHSGFAVAALGMVVGLLTFVIGKINNKNLGGLVPEGSPFGQSFFVRVLSYAVLTAACIVAICFFYTLFIIPQFTVMILVITSVAIFASILFQGAKEESAARKRLAACIILTVLSMGFWAVYNQTFSSLMLYAARNMNPDFLGLHVTPEMTQFINPFFIIVLAPLLSRLWLKLDEKKCNPSIPMKFSLAQLCIAIGFLALAVGDYFFQHNGMVSPAWLTLSYFIQTVGEMLISPIGLAMITALSPKRLGGMMMGFWFFSSATAFGISGGLATISDVPKRANVLASLKIYDHAFLIYALLALGLFVVSLALVPTLKKMIR